MNSFWGDIIKMDKVNSKEITNNSEQIKNSKMYKKMNPGRLINYQQNDGTK